MLITRCPHCMTSFRIRPEQLNVRGGRVRCGHCQQPFSALSSLDEMPEEQAAARLTPTPETPATAAANPPATAHDHLPVEDEDSFELDIDDMADELAEPAIAIAPAAQTALAFTADDDSEVIAIGSPADDMADLAAIEPGMASEASTGEAEPGETVPQLHTIFLDDDLLRPVADPAATAARRRTRIKLWAANILLLLSGTALSMFALRVPLTNNWPALRQPLEQACEKLGCSVPYSKYANDITLEGYTLTPAGKPDTYQLMVTLRNEARYPVAWPQLDLALTDRYERTLARRVLDPQQWLPPETLSKPAFEANSELTAHILLSGNLQPEGYRIGVFYR